MVLSSAITSLFLFVLFECSKCNGLLIDSLLIHSRCMREIEILWHGCIGSGGSGAASIGKVPVICNRTV